MYTVAIIGDVLSLVPGLNIVTNIITAITLGIIGFETGVNIYSSDRILGTLGAMVVESIPVVSIVPAWTLRVYLAKKVASLN